MRINFGGPLRPGDRVTIEWQDKKFEAVIEEIAFRATEEVGPGLHKAEPIRVTLGLIRPL